MLPKIKFSVISLCVFGWVACDVVNCHNELIFRPKQSKCLNLKTNSLRSFETSGTTSCTTHHIQKELKLQMPIEFAPVWDKNLVFSYWQVNCSTAQYIVTMSSFRHMFNLLAPELFFLILAHSVYKTWIIQEPNKLELWNKLHFK